MRRLWAAALLLPAAVSLQASTPTPRRPNIVIIMFDDMSPRIGAFGDTLARTPNLDAFAKTAIRYPNTFTTAPVCAPSRAALFSGRYQQTIGAQHMRTQGTAGLPGGGPIEYQAVPPPKVKFLPELLRRAGYYTINVGKTDYQIGEPFTIWDVNAPKADWRTRPEDKPFFAFINLHRTHESYLWPEDLQSTNPLVQRVVARNRQELAGKEQLTDPAKVRVPAYLPDTPVVRADIARVYDNIAFDEREVGTIMATLKSQGVLDNTIVIVTSDHGDGLPRMKRAIYDAGLRVPLMVRLPRNVGANTEQRELVSFVDLAPTIVKLAGLPVPKWMQGQAFLGNGRAEPRRYAFAGSDRFDEQPEWQRTAMDGRWQYVRNLRPDVPYFRHVAFRDVMPATQELWRLHDAGQLSPSAEQYFSAPRQSEELYDLTTDPDTVMNVASDPRYRTTLIRMRKSFQRWTALVGDQSRLPERDMVARMWPSLVQPMTATPIITHRFSLRRGATIGITSATSGASIGYRIAGDKVWRLYVKPFSVPDSVAVEAKAIRYGYRESPVVRSGERQKNILSMMLRDRL
jgi:N-sulfoglucosamine sulfohydrolase